MEAAAYRVLIAAAEAVGDTQTQAVCERILQEELSMASDLERQLPILTRTVDRTDQSFSIAVLPWGTRRRRSIANAHGSKSSDEDLAIGPISITDQIAGSLLQPQASVS